METELVEKVVQAIWKTKQDAPDDRYALRMRLSHDEARRAARAAIAAIDESRSVSGWRDIESAPRDGTRVLAARFDSDVGEWIYYAVALSLQSKPFTHWQPLPAPPYGGVE